MRILGIDPGYATIGFGLIEGERGQYKMVTYGAITTSAGLPLSKRLYQIDRNMEELIGQLKPDAISIEELFFNTNITTGIAVAHGRGVLLCAAERCGVPLYEYTPGQVKMAVTGYGKAEKRQVMDMTKAAAEADKGSTAGRCRRCAGLGALPRTQLYLPPSADQAGKGNRIRRIAYVLLSGRYSGGDSSGAGRD